MPHYLSKGIQQPERHINYDPGISNLSRILPTMPPRKPTDKSKSSTLATSTTDEHETIDINVSGSEPDVEVPEHAQGDTIFLIALVLLTFCNGSCTPPSPSYKIASLC